MDQEKLKSVLTRADGMRAFALLDANGTLLDHDLDVFDASINPEETASWLMNFISAVETYYPETNEISASYDNFDVLFSREADLIVAVIVDKGYEASEFRAVLRQGRGRDAQLTNMKRKKGDTVFLKLGEDAPAMSNDTPIPAGGESKSKPTPPVAPAARETAPAPAPATTENKSGNNSMLTVFFAMLATGAIVALVLLNSGGGKEDADTSGGQATTESSTGDQAPQKSAADIEAEAISLQAEVSGLAMLAESEDAANRSIAAYNSASMAANSAKEFIGNGDYSKALVLLNQAKSQFGRAAYDSVEAAYEEALEANTFENARQFAPAKWLELDSLASEAKNAYEAEDYAVAVDSYNKAIALLPQIAKTAYEDILTQAKKAVANNEIDQATFFYDALANLDPAHPDAMAFLYNYKLQPGEKFVSATGFTLCYIPPGEFTMGSPADEALRDSDEAQHRVRLTKGFYMSATEVSQTEWQRVMGRSLNMLDPEPGFIGESLPVHSITFQQAIEFCEKLSELEGVTYRLPTEAEWEYACRAGSQTPFNNSLTRLTSREANIFDPAGEIVDAPLDVGTTGDPNTWGLFDMHGNVWEWCSDWSSPYTSGLAIDPVGPGMNDRRDLAMKIVRGGSFYDEADKARSANRWEYSPSVFTNYIGFRIVREISQYTQ